MASLLISVTAFSLSGQDPTREQLLPGTAFRYRLGPSGVETLLPHLAYLTLRAGKGS
jgi:hypothetical protein